MKTQQNIKLFLTLAIGALSILIVFSATNPTAKAQIPSDLASERVADTGTGYEQLPAIVQARSMSSLIAAGLVHLKQRDGAPKPLGRSYQNNPLDGISWGPPVNISGRTDGNPGANEPGAAMHPTDALRAIVGGNSARPAPQPVLIETTSDRGSSWVRQIAPISRSANDGVPGWLADGVSALFVGLYFDATQNRGITRLAASTDQGITWNSVNNTNIDTPLLNNDRPYLWTDFNLSGKSSCAGAMYLTETLLGTVDTYDTVGVRRTTDGGVNWSPFFSLVDPYEFARGEYHNSIATLAIQPTGQIVASWHRGSCCMGSPPSPVYVPNKVMWSRSSDCGLTFPISGTVTTVPLDQSISFNSRSPVLDYDFPWSDDPNIAADPVDGTLYVVWAQYRTPNNPNSAGIYLSKGSPDGTQWSTPVIVNNDYPTNFQYFPWVQVSKDHTLHITYSAVAPNGSSNQSLAHFYVQSTDAYTTWPPTFSPPFRLNEFNNGIYPARNFMGDYEAASIGGYTGSEATILTTWTDTTSGQENRWGRFGTFQLSIPTPTLTPTPTPTPCTPIPATSTPGTCVRGNYITSRSPGTLPTVTTRIDGTGCDDCVFPIALPFNFSLYNHQFAQNDTIYASSNGNLQFLSSDPAYDNVCLPASAFNYAILPHWDDLDTTDRVGCPPGGCGIYTSVTSSGGQQVFNIEWRACYLPLAAQKGKPNSTLPCNQGYLIFAVRLYQGSNQFDVIYDGIAAQGVGATIGVQEGTGSRYTQYSCNSTPPAPIVNQQLTFSQPPCAPAPCPIQFADVDANSPFYAYVRCLACRGVISGYGCGGPGEPCCPTYYPYFRTYSLITRAQLVKMVTVSIGLGENYDTATFADVPSSNPFYLYIEQLARRGYISGYACGGPGEPCDPQNRPYFRPYANITRAQIAKVVANAAGYNEDIPTTRQTFADVLPADPFWLFIERVYLHGVISGYNCGGPGEPCDPQNRSYYRPGANATRGQTAKIVANTFSPNCQTPNGAGRQPGSGTATPPGTPPATPLASATIPLPTAVPTMPLPLPSPVETAPMPTVAAP